MGVSFVKPACALVAAGAFVIAGGGTASAQMRPAASKLILRLPPRPITSAWAIAGTWVYRSWINAPTVMINGDANTALSLLFGEGTMTLKTPSYGVVTGTFDMGGGYVLDLSGTSKTAPGGPTVIHLAGLGRANTPTAGWEYDYDGELALKWPNGVSQIPAIAGSVFRAKPHNGNPAGLVAAFIAVKKS